MEGIGTKNFREDELNPILLYYMVILDNSFFIVFFFLNSLCVPIECS